jgi:hypothetical protein
MVIPDALKYVLIRYRDYVLIIDWLFFVIRV